MNHEGAPLNAMRDHISFHMRFLLVIDPFTEPPMTSKLSRTVKHFFSSSVTGLTYSPLAILFEIASRIPGFNDINCLVTEAKILRFVNRKLPVLLSFSCSWLKAIMGKYRSFWNLLSWYMSSHFMCFG